MARHMEERGSGHRDEEGTQAAAEAAATPEDAGGRRGRGASSAAWVGYAVALLGTAVVLAVRLLLDPLMGDQGPLLGFAVSVALAAWYGGRGPGLLATVAGLLSGWFFVVRPSFSLRIDRREDAYHLGLFIAVGLLTTWIGDRERKARRQIEADREEEARLLAEQERLLAELGEAGVRQRRFLKEMLAGFTEGRLRLCFSEAE